jgi:hypothetical protein
VSGRAAAGAQQDLAEALVKLVNDVGARAIGRMTGHAGTTISAWGGDLHAWPVGDALTVAAESRPVREAFAACLGLVQATPPGQALAAEHDLRAVAGMMGRNIQAMMERLADARINAIKARATIADLVGMVDLINSVLPDLRARAEAGGR